MLTMQLLETFLLDPCQDPATTTCGPVIMSPDNAEERWEKEDGRAKMRHATENVEDRF